MSSSVKGACLAASFLSDVDAQPTAAPESARHKATVNMSFSGRRYDDPFIHLPPRIQTIDTMLPRRNGFHDNHRKKMWAAPLDPPSFPGMISFN
jgi:hypothetical protein